MEKKQVFAKRVYSCIAGFTVVQFFGDFQSGYYSGAAEGELWIMAFMFHIAF
ncbi:MAG: hypothetical protein IJ091_04635 [Oscillospiraceae bacterium]|nr:hypothetical protein [Oscillospiraceae bacterium]